MRPRVTDPFNEWHIHTTKSNAISIIPFDSQPSVLLVGPMARPDHGRYPGTGRADQRGTRSAASNWRGARYACRHRLIRMDTMDETEAAEENINTPQTE